MKRLTFLAALGGAVVLALLAGCGQQWGVSAQPVGEVASAPPEDRQVLFETRFIACPPKAIDELAIDWQRMENPYETLKPWRPTAKDRVPEPVAEPTTAPAGGRVDRILAQPVIVRWAVLDANGEDRLIQKAYYCQETRVLTCPRVTLDSGQQCRVWSYRGGPYVANIGGRPTEAEESEMEFEVIGYSPEAFLCGRIADGNQVAVSCRIHVSEHFLRSKLPAGTSKPDPDSLQGRDHPFLRRPPTYYRIAAAKTLESGRTLALRLYPAPEKDAPDLALVVLVRPVIGSPREPDWEAQPRLPL